MIWNIHVLYRSRHVRLRRAPIRNGLLVVSVLAFVIAGLYRSRHVRLGRAPIRIGLLVVSVLAFVIAGLVAKHDAPEGSCIWEAAFGSIRQVAAQACAPGELREGIAEARGGTSRASVGRWRARLTKVPYPQEDVPNKWARKHQRSPLYVVLSKITESRTYPGKFYFADQTGSTHWL
jgi:hypothetical protein